jgi:hypothetical protein
MYSESYVFNVLHTSAEKDFNVHSTSCHRPLDKFVLIFNALNFIPVHFQNISGFKRSIFTTAENKDAGHVDSL